MGTTLVGEPDSPVLDLEPGGENNPAADVSGDLGNGGVPSLASNGVAQPN